ncbi:MAG: hypothetical protein DBY17_09675 [Oscillospiraceae bacterium]|nr:MAG: hypothetical protein DBY17_09675 [Oscillospiraceae bacterium]
MPLVNGVLPIACRIFLVLNTISLRSKLTAKALLLSPAQPGLAVLRKLTNTNCDATLDKFMRTIAAHIQA